MVRLEHANITVTDTQAVTNFLLTAFPEFRVRGGGVDSHGKSWSHVGDDNFYVAISSMSDEAARKRQRNPYSDQAGLNHLGWEVEDVAALKQRMLAAGYTLSLEMDDHPARNRIYFYDPTGTDWEFVQYLTSDTDERNSYSA